MAQRDFFESKSPQAVLKHGLLSRYAYYFAGRAGHATDGRIAFIDGYSGAGRYEDGSAGSPLLLASSAARAETMNRDVRLAFVEPDPGVRQRLRSTLRVAEIEPDQVIEQSLELAIEGLLDRYKDRAVLLFVDPFGLALSYNTLISVLRRSRSNGPVDVLFHFSTLTVARMGRAVIKGVGAATNASQLDRALGPVDWRTPLKDLPALDGAPTQAAIELARQFSEAVAADCGVPSLSVPVRKRPGHVPVFLLTLFCRDPVGKALWDFADMAGKAHIDWLLRCETDDYTAYLNKQQNTPTLFELQVEPSKPEIEKVILDRASAYLPAHLERLVRERGSLRPQDDPAAAFGDMLGVAREKHLRAALKQLESNGLVTGQTVGQFRKETFTWLGTTHRDPEPRPSR
jgi:three-Cys-motif partner protein